MCPDYVCTVGLIRKIQNFIIKALLKENPMNLRRIYASTMAAFTLTLLSANQPLAYQYLDPAYSAQVLIRAGDLLSDGEHYAPDNDRVSYFPLGPEQGYLLVGHELHYQNEENNGQYSRLSYKRGKIIAGELWFKGMHNFCSGKTTPWGTLLSGEEYPMNAFTGTYKERDHIYNTKWVKPNDPEARFGWVYEIDPWTNERSQRARRLTALGRFSHEGIVIANAREVYMAEDWKPGFLYKFVATRPHDLSEGQLFALGDGKWIPLNDVYNAHLEALNKGAKKLNKPEDMVMGLDGHIYVSESGDSKLNDPFGRVLRFNPETLALSPFVEGDGKTMANPDNLAVHPQTGELLICEDQSSEIAKKFGENEVWWADTQGKLRLFMRLNDGGEPSGPDFSADGKHLFMSVINGKKSLLFDLKPQKK